MKRSPLAAYRREVADARRWLKDHERICDVCAETPSDDGRCENGQMMARYLRNNQKIVTRLEEDEKNAPIQAALFDLDGGHVPA